MSQSDPYKILQVSREASQEEIKRSYRKLAKQYHPDRNPNNPEAERKFKEIQAAYEVLGDEQRRRQYDRFGAGGPVPNYQQWDPHGPAPDSDIHFDFSSLGDLTGIFEQFFRRGGGGFGGGGVRFGGFGGDVRGPQTRPRGTPGTAAAPGANMETSVELSFEEAVQGTTRSIELQDPQRGRERIEFRVPPGVSDGQRIRLTGKGNYGPTGQRGDLLIRCRIQPHRFFHREGLDIVLNVPLTFREATLGAKVEIPTLHGVTTMTVPPGTSTGTRLRLRGQGIKDRSGNTGDMYAVVQVAVPQNPSDKARELVEALDAELDQQPREALGWPVHA